MRVGIIGHFGGNENFLDGQTVKTKILYDELKKETDWDIIKVDTYYKKKNPLILLSQLILVLLTTKNIIVLLSEGGRKVFFPILYFMNKVFGTKIYHDVIGGHLDFYVQKNSNYVKYLNSFKVNWVETKGLKNKLINVGITNCMVIPNFKRLNIVSKKEITSGLTENGIFKFCTFSRVMKEKGIDIAIDAIETINKEEGKTVCKLDIYGPIDETYREEFEKKLCCSTAAVNYLGKVPYDKSVETLKGYYALLFPSYWQGEGFPGTIVDAFSAGLPVIATNWNCNSEIITDGIDGIIYPNEKFNDLKSIIKWSIQNEIVVANMKKNSIVKAQEFCPEKYIDIIVNSIKNS